MKDTLLKNNVKWGPIITSLNYRNTPISQVNLQASNTDGVSHVDLSQGLWAFMADYLNTSMYENREQMAPEGNGFELWRRYFVEFKGRDREIKSDGKLEFMQLTRHGRTAGLSEHLDRWETLRTKYCVNMPDDETFTLLLNTIPEELKLQAMVDTTLVSTSLLMDWIRLRTDAFLQHANSEQLIRERAKGARVPTNPMLDEAMNALAARPAGRGRSPGPGAGAAAKPKAAAKPWAAAKAKAAAKPGGKAVPRSGSRDRPDPKFPGCWHCLPGDPGHFEHQRQNCPKYKSDKEKNGGQHVPGAYESSKGKAQMHAAVPNGPDEPETDDESEGEPVLSAAPCMFWPVMNSHNCNSESCCSPNPFEALSEKADSLVQLLNNDIDEEDGKLIAALEKESLLEELSEWAKVRRGKKKNGKFDLSKASNIFLSEVQKKSSILDDMRKDLEDDEELVLMDSGCGDHASNPENHFLQYKTRSSKGQRAGQKFVLADKSEIANEGEKEVHFATQEGHECATVFQQAKVGMPIFSIRKLGRTHRTMFADKSMNEGWVEHRTTNQRSHFFSMYGVYFMKIKVRKPDQKPPDMDFVRPA